MLSSKDSVGPARRPRGVGNRLHPTQAKHYGRQVPAGVLASPDSAAASARRPVAVTIVTVLAVIAAVYSFVDATLTLTGDDGSETGRLVDGLIHVGLGVVAIVAAYGAYEMRPWAWKIFMTWAVAGLTIQLLRHFAFGDARYARMALNTFIVFALTPRDVQVAYGMRPPPNADLARTTRNPLDRA